MKNDKKPVKLVTVFEIDIPKQLTKKLVKEATGKIDVPKSENKN